MEDIFTGIFVIGLTLIVIGAMLGIMGLIWWGIGVFVTWAFGIHFIWTFWHGVAVALVLFAFKKAITITVKKEN